jgi:hypothetical protein
VEPQNGCGSALIGVADWWRTLILDSELCIIFCGGNINTRLRNFEVFLG